MALTINTNLSSLIVQRNLSAATNSLNQAIERMTTGYKINHASDNAAGYSIATDWQIKLSSLDVAVENTSMGMDLLTTAEDSYSLVTSHLQRVRDLTEQAANGTYGTDSLDAIEAEITARLEEIDRIVENVEYNGIHLMNGDQTTAINLQVGIDAETSSKITLADTLFEDVSVQGLFREAATAVAGKCAATATAAAQLTEIDKAIATISGRVTTIGAAQNRLESASSALNVQIENLTSSLSTIRDADVAEESSSYINAQILQQASATLLATANQTPSIALSLIK